MPPWVRPSSSPASSIGTPCDSSSVVRILRIWRRRSARISGSSSAPRAAVAAVVVVRAVAIVLLVGLVVLLLVADQVAQREAVVRGDEVDARPGPAAAVVEDVARAGDARGQRRQLALVALPELPHGVAIAIVPLRPARREIAELIAAGPVSHGSTISLTAPAPDPGDRIEKLACSSNGPLTRASVSRGRSGSRRPASPRPSSASCR